MKRSLNDFYKELKTYAEKNNLPVTYREWEENNAPALPYLIYYETGKNPFYADNNAYFLSNLISVELYTDKKDLNLESLMEAFFYDQNITLSSVTSEFWNDEHLHEVLYEFEI